MDFIDTFKQYLKDDPIISAIFGAILGVIATVILDKARERIKRLWWGAKNITYEQNYFGKNGDFSVSQNGDTKYYRHTPRDLSICRFILWSSGKEILLDSDILSIEPVLITFNYQCDIVGIENFIPSNSTIYYEIINLHQIVIYFEYLELNEGVVFDILYAGNDAEPYLSGVIKGGKISIKKMNPPDLSYMPKHQLLFGWLKPAQQIIAIRWFYTVGFICSFIFIFSEPSTDLTTASSDVKSYAFWMIFRVIAVLVVSAYMAIELWQTAVVPPKLRQYYENIE